MVTLEVPSELIGCREKGVCKLFDLAIIKLQRVQHLADVVHWGLVVWGFRIKTMARVSSNIARYMYNFSSNSGLTSRGGVLKYAFNS